MGALVAKLVLEADREIATALVSVGFDAVEAILIREGIVASIATFALGQMIADAVLATELMNAEIWHMFADFVDALMDGSTVRGALKLDSRQTLVVFLSAELLVEHAVFLLVQTRAAEAIRTAEAILAETAVTAVAAILAIVTHVASRAVNALRTPLAIRTERETG